MTKLYKWKNWLCLGWMLTQHLPAMAQDQVPRDADLLDVRFTDVEKGETVNLVLKSGSRKFKLVCDNVNNLAAMLQGLGFPEGYKPKAVRLPGAINEVIADLAKTQPIYCKSYTPRNGENPLSYSIGYYGADTYLWNVGTVNNAPKTFLYKITGCQGILKSFSYASNATSEDDRSQDIIARPKYLLAVKQDENQKDLEIKCYDGKPIETEMGPVFANTKINQSIIAGQAITPITLSVSDVNNDAIETFNESSNCNWLKFDPANNTVTGQSYPSTLPYSCHMQVNALANKDKAVVPAQITIDVQPVTISKLAAGYRRNCAVFNDGKVSCWGLGTGADDSKISRNIEGLQGASELALTRSSAPTYQGIAGLLDNELVSFDSKLLTKKDDYAPILADGKLVSLRAGLDMYCVGSDNKDAICYGPNVRFYDVPQVAEKYSSFDVNFSMFCGQKDGNANIACRGTTLSFPAADVAQYSSSKDALCVRKSTGAVSCLSRRANDLVATGIPDVTGSKDFTLGFDFGCALKDGKPLCWGPANNDVVIVPEPAKNLMGVTNLVGGFDHICLQQSNKQNVYCWGGNLFNDVNVSRPMDIVKLRTDLDRWDTMPLDSF